MNVHANPKGPLSMSEAVEKIAAEYARAEKHLSIAHRALVKMSGLYLAVHTEGTIGYLEQLERSARARSIAGRVADAELAIAQAHRDDTARANELGVDIPVLMSGGGR